MSGSGNSFVVIDDRAFERSLRGYMDLAPILCTRKAIDLPNAEGILVLRDTGVNCFAADFINPDGSYGAMCGNGSRVIARFALERGMVLETGNSVAFTLSGHRYVARFEDANNVSVDFPPPTQEQRYPAGTLLGVKEDVYFVNVNSDHVVVLADPETFDPRTLRHHIMFAAGVNVNMVSIIAGDVRIATFERGVEAITGACGTGALSASVALWRENLIGDSVRLVPPSGKPLCVTIAHVGDVITGLSLRGDAIHDAEPCEFDEHQKSYA